MEPLHYISTRGERAGLGFEDVLLSGLARDGGLYVPDRWPTFAADQWRQMRGLPYAELALRVMEPFVAGAIATDALRTLLVRAYASFRHHSVAPLVQLGPDQWLMELYHGPTLAFKDVAMQVLGLLYDHVLEKQDRRITIVGATSGDTGSAAIEAIRGRERASIFIMHPKGRTSEVQRRQMTTVLAPNVHNIAIEGTFDDCQGLLKAMFNDHPFREAVQLSGVNSINWARVVPQVVYYAAAALALGAPDREVCFTVPTGNFGDIYAGYVAKQMGLPIRRLIIASNLNDILTRAMSTGEHKLGQVSPTMSPSMDIQVSSNFERLLFDLYDRDGASVASLMKQLGDRGSFTIDANRIGRTKPLFAAHRTDEQQTLETIRCVHEQTGMLIDPHTAVGVHASRQEAAEPGIPGVVLSTAHPAKFPDAVESATGVRPPLPPRLADLLDRDERYTTLPNDLATVQAHIRERSGMD